MMRAGEGGISYDAVPGVSGCFEHPFPLFFPFVSREGSRAEEALTLFRPFSFTCAPVRYALRVEKEAVLSRAAAGWWSTKDKD